jgi:hypothetical protein
MNFWAGVAIASICCGIAFAFMVLTFAGHRKGWW